MPRFDGTDGLRADIPAYMEALKRETYPTASVVRYEFPARKGMQPVKLTWFDGGIMPPRPADLSDDKDIGANGAFLLGENGTIAHGSHGAGGCRIIPETRMKDYAKNLPDKTIPRVEGHHADWLNACKGGNPSCANFDYGGALTEMVLLGVIAMRVNNKKLKWDAKKMEFTNSDEANAFVKPIYRKGWTL
jgi:hypothetical protein